MAAEPKTLPPPPEPPIATATALEPVVEPTTAVQPSTENSGPTRKRQRRPSVRLGEIGNQRAADKAHKSETRRLNMPPWSWKTPKEASRAAKGRFLTNIANGFEESNGISEFANRRGKAKRGSTSTKRLRSNQFPKTTTDDADDDGDEGIRDFNNDQSPVNSVQQNFLENLDDDEDYHARDLEDDVESSDSREWKSNKKCEFVRSWLMELGLSKYAPIFEIHEVDDELLPLLTLEDLKDMGINAVGSRRKMYTAIQKLQKGFP
ncbi:putative sterile alpha motif/pointed domain-containing protein [Lupinus albus]|uniref:Putative sterile alpha motif/pointed domain-containing protein n=1 Tax=Lupinus albus TaxID=3870 RepID=A0A6A4PU90_LUPAL|nr:putative sterile alpha motif/pointed domain-containing protein [Lupinus albus]